MEKIARICWNTNGWKRPSGSAGKSRYGDSYEKQNGFGHEEWLLDNSKIMPDGYHYGFLEQLRITKVKSGKHVGQTYDIHLFTISPQKEKIYVGCLHNAKCISEKESKKVYDYYVQKDWLKDLEDDVNSVGGTVHDFTPNFMFNVKFKFSEAVIYSSNQPIIKKDTLGHRYNLMDKMGDFEFEKNKDGKTKTIDTSLIVRINKNGKIMIDPLHKKIQHNVVKLLKAQYDEIDFEKSQHVGHLQKVDIMGKCKETGEWHYFEVKTYSAKRSIREALGQILEYAHYPNANRATKLFIIGPDKPDMDDCAYMDFLRNTYNIPVWYRWYSFEEDKLHEGI